MNTIDTAGFSSGYQLDVLCIHGRPGSLAVMDVFEQWCNARFFNCHRYTQLSQYCCLIGSLDSNTLLDLLVDELYSHVMEHFGNNLLIIAHSFGAALLCEVFARNVISQKNIKIVLSGFSPLRGEFLEVNKLRLQEITQRVGVKDADRVFFESHICSVNALSSCQLISLNTKPQGDIEPRLTYLPLLGSIECPVLLTYGSSDICTEFQAAQAAKVLKKCHVVCFEGARHYPFLEKTSEYFDVLDSFLKYY